MTRAVSGGRRQGKAVKHFQMDFQGELYPRPVPLPGQGRGPLFGLAQLPRSGYFFFTSLSTSAFMLAFSATMKDSKSFPLM